MKTFLFLLPVPQWDDYSRRTEPGDPLRLPSEPHRILLHGAVRERPKSMSTTTAFRMWALALAALVTGAALSACATIPAGGDQQEYSAARTTGSNSATTQGDGSLLAAEAAFIDAFNGLDQARFDAAWAEDATIFFPRGPFPAERIEGKAEITAVFKRLFDAVRARNPAARLNIKPTKLLTQQYGDVGVVTFELEGADARGRRTLVMRRTGGRWLIVHMHASEQPVPKPGTK